MFCWSSIWWVSATRKGIKVHFTTNFKKKILWIFLSFRRFIDGLSISLQNLPNFICYLCKFNALHWLIHAFFFLKNRKIFNGISVFEFTIIFKMSHDMKIIIFHLLWSKLWFNLKIEQKNASLSLFMSVCWEIKGSIRVYSHLQWSKKSAKNFIKILTRKIKYL